MYNISKKSSIAVDVFANIARNIINNINFGALQPVNHSQGTKLPSTYVVNSQQYQTIMEHLGITYPNDKLPVPYVTSGLDNNHSVIFKKPNFNSNEKMPDVSGMIASDAVSELTRAGYKVKIKGYGVVRQQKIDADSNSVTLYLE